LEGFDGIFFSNVGFNEALVVVEVDKISRPVILASLAVLWAVSSEVPYFSALEAGIRQVSRGSCVALEVVLWAIPLVSVGVLSSSEVVASVVSSVVSSGRRPVPIDVHRDRGVVHPSRGVR